MQQGASYATGRSICFQEVLLKTHVKHIKHLREKNYKDCLISSPLLFHLDLTIRNCTRGMYHSVLGDREKIRSTRQTQWIHTVIDIRHAVYIHEQCVREEFEAILRTVVSICVNQGLYIATEIMYDCGIFLIYNGQELLKYSPDLTGIP